MTLDDLNMNELRELGYLLEAYVDREVRAGSLEGLRAEISDALLELDEEQLEEFVAKAGLDVDPDGEVAADDESAESGKTSGDGEPFEEKEPATDVETIIQLRCHPREGGLYNGDLVRSPKQWIVDRYPHAKLDLDEAKSLHARGYRWNADPRYSENEDK